MATITVRWRHPIIASIGAFGLGVHNTRRGEIFSSDSQGTRRCKADLELRGQQYMGGSVTQFSDNVTETLTNPNFDCAFTEGDTISVWKATLLIISVGRASYHLSGAPQQPVTRTIVNFGLGVDMFSFDLIVRNVRSW